MRDPSRLPAIGCSISDLTFVFEKKVGVNINNILKCWFLKLYRYLKILGLYLYTLKIGRKSCNMSIILNKLLLQKELQIL